MSEVKVEELPWGGDLDEGNGSEKVLTVCHNTSLNGIGYLCIYCER